jgi:hypothetical protein
VKKLPLILCLLLATLVARADVITVEAMTNGSQTATITTKIKGDKSRTDISSQGADPGDTSSTSIIADVDSGDIITLVHESKSFLKFSADKTKSLVDEMQKTKANALAAPKIIDTGRAEKVGDYATEVYTAQTQTAKYTYWVAKDFPDFATLQDQMRKFQIRQADLKRKLGMKEDLSPDIWTLDGMVVKTIILTQVTNEKGVTTPATTVTTLVTARNQTLDPADFQIPADYIEMDPSQPQSQHPVAPAPAQQ